MFEHLHDLNVSHFLYQDLKIFDGQILNIADNRFWKGMFQRRKESSYCGQFKHKHLFFKSFVLLFFDYQIKDHVYGFDFEWFIVAVSPHYLTTAIEQSFFFFIRNSILDIKLNIIPKLCIFFVYKIRFPTSITHSPNQHRNIFESKSTFIEPSLNNNF